MHTNAIIYLKMYALNRKRLLVAVGVGEAWPPPAVCHSKKQRKEDKCRGNCECVKSARQKSENHFRLN